VNLDYFKTLSIQDVGATVVSKVTEYVITQVSAHGFIYTFVYMYARIYVCPCGWGDNEVKESDVSVYNCHLTGKQEHLIYGSKSNELSPGKNENRCANASSKT